MLSVRDIQGCILQNESKLTMRKPGIEKNRSNQGRESERIPSMMVYKNVSSTPDRRENNAD